MSKPYFLKYGLMVKQELLNEIHVTSKNLHRLARSIEHLTSNFPVNIQILPQDIHHAKFSEWFSSRLIQLKKFSALKVYTDKLQALYSELQPHYSAIYDIYSTERKQTWIRSILHLSSLPLPVKTRKESQIHYKQFAKIIQELLFQLDRLEKCLAIQPNEDLLTYI